MSMPKATPTSPYPAWIHLHNMTLDAMRIGVYSHEQGRAQRVIAHLDVQIDSTRAACSDNVAETVDYDALVRALKNVAYAKHYKLLESLADAIVRTIYTEFPLLNMRLRLEKPGAVTCADVSFSLEYPAECRAECRA